jgi:hypothetical protein
MIVEKRLWKDKQLLRSQISDNEFLRYCEEWKDEYAFRPSKEQLKCVLNLGEWRT